MNLAIDMLYRSEIKCAGIAVNMANRAVEEIHECCERYQTSKGVRSSASLILLATVFHRHIKKNGATFRMHLHLLVVYQLSKPTTEISMLMRGSNSWKKVIKNVLAEHTIHCQEGQLQGDFSAEDSVNLWNNGIYVTEFDCFRYLS